MQINIMAGLHHSIINADPREQHKYCMDQSVQWCNYKKQLENPQSKSKNTKKKDKLPQSFLPHMLPLYKRLSDESLLKRCVSGLTQNQNESFNGSLWQRCPKERYFGAAAVKRALALSVSAWNMGSQSLIPIFHNLNLKTSFFTKKAIILKDNSRLSSATRSMHVTRKRKLHMQPESSDYIPGGH